MDVEFLRVFQETVLALDRDAYKEFKAQPEAVCLKHLTDFISKKDDADEKVSSALLELQIRLTAKLQELQVKSKSSE